MFQKVVSNSGSRHKKLSLIRILYIYPVIFFLVGLSAITSYYTWLQINDYNNQVEKLRNEFPEKQRAELKSRILLLKDYIYWVKSHAEDYTVKLLNNRINSAEELFETYNLNDSSLNYSLPEALCDSLSELNKKSIFNIIVLNNRNEVLYPEYPLKQLKGDKTPGILPGNIRYINIITADSLIRKLYQTELSSTPIMLIKDCKKSNIKLGILFNPEQKTEIIQEVVLDSLSKIKFSNNEYVIINTFSGYALLSKGERQIPPINIKDSKEANWKEIFIKELHFAKLREGGYYTYFWRNRADDERSQKTSYFSGINDWQWIIGTGFFTNDIEPVINAMNNELWKNIFNNFVRFFVFLVLLSILAHLTMRYYAEKAKSNILLFQNFFKRAAQGMQIIDSTKLAFSEFDTLAQAANQMIYERERIKTVLSAEKSRLRYMIDAIPDLIFFKDADSKFMGCNTAFEKYINKKSEEITGLSEYELFRKSEASGYIKSDKRIVNSLLPERSTNWVEYPNGQRCLFYTLKTPYFDSDNNLLGIIGISRDITEMEETRQRLILAKEKAEESDKLKTAFLANMSHEIRTPMNAIIGFSDLLSEEDLTDEDKIDFISKIKSSGRALMSLINDIIDIAKIEAGQLKVAESACDLNHLLKDIHGTFEELKNASGKRNITLKLTVPEITASSFVITDPMRLQQILTNLLSNALKFTEFGSIEFGYTIHDGDISFYVKDTGIGILRSKQKYLFQRFSQLDPSTTRKYGGTGLGLAISKNLVDLLGGTIGMESNPGKGSIFYFAIPYKPTEKKVLKFEKLNLNHINWHGKTILIAEDIMQNFLLMEALLKRTEVRLLHAINGQVAIDIIKSDPDINLVLMDIQLPLKTGYEALKEILEIRPDLPVMSYTAFALPHEREKSLSAGFVDFIPKPIKVETLIPILDKYLQNQD